MASSPSPNSPPSAVPPASSNSPPAQPSAPPPDPPRSTLPEPPKAPPPQLNSPPVTTTRPPQSSPPTNVAPPPPATTTTQPPQSPPPALTPPPVASPPTTTPPPQPTPSPPPATAPPPSLSPPPPSIPPVSSSPPPSANPPPNSTPPPSNPPVSSPPDPPSSPLPPSPNPPSNSPPPHSSIPPTNPPPPPPEPPKNDPPPPPSPKSSPPPPSTQPPQNPPPPPSSKPPENSPPQPAAEPPRKSPPPPAPSPPETLSPPPPLVPPTKSPPPFMIPPSPPSSNSPQRSSPPPVALLSPPPPSVVPPPTNTDNSSSNAPERSHSTGGIGTGGTVAIASGLVLLFLAILATLWWCIWKRKKKVSGINGSYIIPTSLGSPKTDPPSNVQTSAPNNGSVSGSGVAYSRREPGGLGNSRSSFAFEELVEATNGFSSQNLLGEGGFGSVYKGCLADGKVVAVKQLKIGGGQGDREFRSEVEIISRIHHRHLVSLVGYCISENRRLLVYDYVPNNTLYFHLHGEGRPVMDWPTRVRVAVGAARGIAYLHEDCHPRIIHRDIKSSNILLDNNFEARVSDFGLAKFAMDTNSHITTRVMGTFGYMAPEYATSGKLTEKSDGFSFGVVLLELITGRKSVDTSQPLGEESLVEWARPLLSHAMEKEEFDGLVDSRLGRNYIDSEMFRMIEAAAVCVRHSAAKRPKMGQVVRAFGSMAIADLTNGMRVGESEAFNSAEQSAEIRLFQRMAFGSQDYSTDFFSQNSWSSEHHLGG